MTGRVTHIFKIVVLSPRANTLLGSCCSGISEIVLPEKAPLNCTIPALVKRSVGSSLGIREELSTILWPCFFNFQECLPDFSEFHHFHLFSLTCSNILFLRQGIRNRVMPYSFSPPWLLFLTCIGNSDSSQNRSPSPLPVPLRPGWHSILFIHDRLCDLIRYPRFSERKRFTFSLPWPIRSSSKEYQAPLFSTMPVSAKVEDIAFL